MPRGASACVEVVMEYVLCLVEPFGRPALARRRRPKGVTSGRLADPVRCDILSQAPELRIFTLKLPRRREIERPSTAAQRAPADQKDPL